MLLKPWKAVRVKIAEGHKDGPDGCGIGFSEAQSSE